MNDEDSSINRKSEEKKLYRSVILKEKEDKEKEKKCMATKTATNPASATTDQQNNEAADVVNIKDSDSGQQQKYIPRKK